MAPFLCTTRVPLLCAMLLLMAASSSIHPVLSASATAEEEELHHSASHARIPRSRPLLHSAKSEGASHASSVGSEEDYPNHIERWGVLEGAEQEGDMLVLPSEGRVNRADNTSSSSAAYYADSDSTPSSSCEATYGFLPCTDTALGNLFLLAVYSYLMFVAAKLLSEGSELLLTVLDAGIIGGLLLPILGALPDAILILVSGLGGTTAEAQEQVLVGIGLLAGSIVMLLTILWGGCLVLGRCDIEKLNDGRLSTVDGTLSNPYDLTNTGVENDDLTKLSARIMIFSVIPFVVAQLPSLFNFSDTGNICVLVGCVLALAGLLSYCLYQVFTPWIQDRRKEIARKMIIKGGIMSKFLKKVGHSSLIDDHGKLNETIAEKLFDTIDVNGDRLVEKKELQFLLQVTMVEGIDNNLSANMVDHIMKEYDVDNDNKLTREEFMDGLRKWCRELNLQSQVSIDSRVAENRSFLDELEKLEEEEEEEEGQKVPLTKSQIVRKAVVLLILGTLVAAVFADPLVDSVTEFSTATQIPSFVISFVLLPLASNSSEAVSSILFSARKKKRNMSLTYSQIYGGVTMNCTMGLGIFLAVVYVRQLVWDFSSEVLIICLVTILMGILASFRKVFPTWMAAIAIFLYPFSIVLVLVLDNVLGWQ